MKTREELAKELKISRKTLYNYMQALDIKDLTIENVSKLEEYAKDKNKSKEFSKDVLLKELETMQIRNAELEKENKTLTDGQKILLQQIEYYQNSIDTEIMQIKNSIKLLLPAPKEEPKKKSFFSRFFN